MRTSVFKKLNLFFFLTLLLISFGSCGSDDGEGEECDKTEFEEVILGTWDTPAIADSEAGTVTFNSDGTGVSSDNALFSSTLGNEDTNNFTWSYSEADSSMDIEYNFDSGSLSTTMGIVEFSCEETTFNLLSNFTITK